MTRPDGQFRAAAAALGQEVALACAPDGLVRWASRAAGRVLGLRRGGSLVEAAARSQEKVRALLVAGARGPVDGWEIEVAAPVGPLVLRVRAAPSAGSVVVVGSAVPSEYLALEERVGEASARLAVLHREAVQGQREAERALAAERRLRALEESVARRTEEARLDAAVKTARLVAHEVNNRLVPLAGYGRMLETRLEGKEGEMASRIRTAAWELAALAERLRAIVRFEEVDTPAGPVLDLEAATAAQQEGS
jgi:signal transduction histidine kinase